MVEVSFSEESVQRSLGGAKLDVSVTDGPRGLRAVGISLAEDRMVELRDWPTELVQS